MSLEHLDVFIETFLQINLFVEYKRLNFTITE